MALLKFLNGPENDLSTQPFHEGYVYVTDNGNMFTDVTILGSEIRLQINGKYASALRKADGTIININDLVKTSDVIDIAHGGTAATTATAARANLDIYSTSEVDDGIEEVASDSKTFSIAPSEWVVNGDKFTKTISYPEMTCGKKGNVPPIITPTFNVTEYNKIDSAIVDIATKTIKLTISEKPTSTIGFIVVDNR